MKESAMNSKGDGPGGVVPSESPGRALRRQAEELALAEADLPPGDPEARLPEEARHTLHELRVHQIELEALNEELRRTQADLETARARYFDLYDLAPVGYCTLSEKGLILEANLTAATLLGVARDALVKQPMSRFILKEDQDIYYLHRKRLSEIGEPQACELRMLNNEGAAFWAHLEATSALSAGHEPACRLVLSDITERKLVEEALVKAKEDYRVLARENELLYQAQKQIALRLQGTLLDAPRSVGGLHFGHAYHSATDDALVGGDFYDLFAASDGRAGVLIGDVSGHGVEAARLAILAKDTIAAYAREYRQPHRVLRETNRLLVGKESPGFVTAFLGFFDSERMRLTYSSAGHPGPLCGRDKPTLPHVPPSLPLGVFLDAAYSDSETEVAEGDLLLLYTDGVTDARRNNEFFGVGGLARSIARNKDVPVEELPEAVLREVLVFSEGVLVDDVALLAVTCGGCV
jgi:PAS domain S-box-containing protein